MPVPREPPHASWEEFQGLQGRSTRLLPPWLHPRCTRESLGIGKEVAHLEGLLEHKMNEESEAEALVPDPLHPFP